MIRPDDPLELLLPGADEAALRRARGLTQFLRLLVDDARRSRAPAVGLDLERARGALESASRLALVRALEDLLRHHLIAVRDVDSCGWPGEAALSAAAAWREVEAARGEHTTLPDLPWPGEPAAEAGARVLAALAEHADPGAARLWRARWAQACEGPRAGEALHREVLATARPRPAPSVLRAAIGGVAACRLERGAVREARAWLGEHALQVSVDPWLRQLFAWTRILLEDESGARAVLQGLPPWGGVLPGALCELREARPEWAFALAGRSATAPPPSGVAAIRERGDCGASVLAVLALAPGRSAQAVHVDAAPALVGGCGTWLAEREGAHAAAGEREQTLIARASALVERAPRDGALRGVLGGRATRAVALVPILDDEGDAVGWVHLEFEHQLVPSRPRLARCASHWRAAVLAARSRPVDEAPPAPRTPPVHDAVFAGLVAALGLKTAQRRWCGYAVEDGTPLLVARGGEGRGFDDPPAGRARGLARALASRAPIHFDEPDPHVAVHAGAASGVVLPLGFEGLPIGLLSIESSRRRDFQGLDLEAWSASADAAAIELLHARFAAWHRERFGFEPWFELARPGFRDFVARLVRAARSRGAALLAGPAGAGKLVLARWLHFESGAPGGPLVVVGPATARAEWPRVLARATGGTLLLEDVDAFEPGVQELLLSELEGGADPAFARTPRILATARTRAVTSLGAALPSGLRPDLALRLGRLRIVVPGLAERRAEIPGLAEALARRFAAEEQVAPPRFADDALALLWRQPWLGNVRELENLIFELVLAHPGELLAAPQVTAVACRAGLELVRRLPTRRVNPRDLAAALWTTRTQGGRSNKTRAALYLGWDPDTLVARLGAAGLDERAGEPQVWELAGEPGARLPTATAALRSSTLQDSPSRPPSPA
ncbi:MAG: hypothetical protein JNK02_04855 [Planctomycetes bacterium]|nr:hypothetical protein [Planctomycetota bacterium]